MSFRNCLFSFRIPFPRKHFSGLSTCLSAEYVEICSTSMMVFCSDKPLLRLLSSNCLAIQRELEFANIIVGYEQVRWKNLFFSSQSYIELQANRYSIRNRAGELVGLIAEDDGVGNKLMRNLAHTHRNFKADVLDPTGRLLLRVCYPLYLCRSIELSSD